jgi:ubiquinone/menaquinone biosynthesis C-methylase UbiE
MKAETESLLCRPGTHEPLRLVSVEGPGGIAQDELVCERSGERFPIRDGIPVFLDESSLSGSNQRYQRFYNRSARLYDAAIALVAKLGGVGEGQARSEYLSELEVQDGDRVLEVSIGTGANLRFLPAKTSYFGLDISWGMLKKCQRNLDKRQLEAELILGNAEELPLRDESFDAVFHVGGINAFNDRAKAIAEMIRVARAGTKIVIVDETAKLMDRFARVPSVARLLREYGDRFSAPAALVPDGMTDLRVQDIVRGNLYCLTFRKP